MLRLLREWRRRHKPHHEIGRSCQIGVGKARGIKGRKRKREVGGAVRGREQRKRRDQAEGDGEEERQERREKGKKR